MVESEPSMLVVSDVHLGALNSNLEQFGLFLDKIINGQYGQDLQALIILGDLIDLGTTVESTFSTDKKIVNILTQLLEIKKKTPIIFVPGNHEVPITSSLTSGTYDEKFNRRKEKFLKKFTNTIVGELFETNMVCQYIILSKWESESTLLLYDSQDQIYKHPIQRIILSKLDLEENYKCLMVHGYHFESDTIRIFVGPIWKSMISYQNLEIKEVYNYFWNVVLKGQRKIKSITIEDMKSDLIKLKELPSEEIDVLFSGLNNLEFNLIKLNMRIMRNYRNSRNLSFYIKGIEEFFEEANCDFSPITHIIYGHSHIKGSSNETINDRQIKIINCGTWEPSKVSYVEILNGGKINVKSFNS